MFKQRAVFFLATFLILSNGIFAQTSQTKEQLALQYYQQQDYEKAQSLFEELLKENPSSSYYYSFLFDCIINLKDYEAAEQLVKRQLKFSPASPQYQVDLGYVYGLLGDEKKKTKINDEIFKKLKNNEAQIAQFANAFYVRKDYDNAINIYLEGRKLKGNNTEFALPLAMLYKVTGLADKMTLEYVNLIIDEPNYLESVQNGLQDEIVNDDVYELVKETVLLEIQKNENNEYLHDLLIWLFIQKKDFAAAFRQQKALDKRFGGNNAQLVRLASVCISNKAYGVAEEIYQYVLDKGVSTPYFYSAKFGLIDIKYLKIMSTKNPSLEELIDIEAVYSSFLNNDFYRFPDVAEKVILRLAEIKAIYLHKVDEAIALLQKYLKAPQITKETQAKMKLNMADYQVLKGDVWEATLLYLQVSKDFTDHPLGHEAKYRNAKLSFYRGDFDWATAQLEVLKGSTSELIANDALRLSLLIQDVLGFDSNEVPLQMYARADFYIFKNQLDTADKILDSLLVQYPDHLLADDVYYSKALICRKKAEFLKAIEFFGKVYTNYSTDLLAAVSMYNAALIYENDLLLPDKASELFEKIIISYPESVFVIDARKHFRAIRDNGKGS